MTHSAWPQLRVEDWSVTKDTLQLWLQIVGKIRMRKSPLVNHWWQVTFYVSPRGLTTSAIPDGTGGVFDIEFDFLDRQMRIRTSGGGQQLVALKPKTVADFHAETMRALDALGIAVRIQATPNEVEPAIPFTQDTEHSSYDAEAAELFWRQLIAVNRVMHEFRIPSTSARSAPCTSFGVRWIWRAHASQAGPRRRIRAELPIRATG